MTKTSNPIYRNKFKACLEWLNNYLAEPRTVNETKDEADFLGFDLGTLYHARRALKVEVVWRKPYAPATKVFGDPEPEIEPSPRASQPGE